MGPGKIIFKESLLPFRYLGMAFAALVPLYREVIFLLVSFVFALSTIAVTGMYDIHARYHYLLHKGIWEDIMISGIDPYGSSDAASKNTPIEKDPSGRRLPPGVFTVLSEVRGALGDLDCQLAVYQAKEVMLNVISVSLEDRDISNIHGQMDVWIKAYATSDDLPPEVRDIPKGAVVISSSLAGKFSKEVAKYSDRIYMELGAWGKNLMKSFQLHGVLELGGGINVIYMNPDDLQELGFQYAPYVIGIERNFSSKGPIREALISAPSLQSLRITRPEDRQRPSPLLFFIQLAPLFLMSLFFFILLILYHYTVLSSYEKRVTELGLMRLYAYPKWKRLVMFFFLNVSPAPFGFFMALGGMAFNWPFSFENFFSEADAGMPLAVSQIELVLNGMVLMVLSGTILILFLMTCLFLLRGRRIDGG